MIYSFQFHFQKLHYQQLQPPFLSLSTLAPLLVFRAIISPLSIAVFIFNLSRSRSRSRAPGFLTRMDFARCTDEPKESESSSTKCCNKIEAGTEIIELRAPIGPSTPDADRESCDFPSDSKSPLTLHLTCVDSLDERIIEAPLEEGLDSSFDPLSSPRTPKDGVFDPFSPAPSHLALAPITRKCFSGSVGFVARRLEFGSSSPPPLQLVEPEEEEEQSISDSELLEAVYESLLEVIVSHQAEASLAQLTTSQTDSPDCITPPASLMNGVAQTCPAAPIKPSGKLRSFDLGLCRKLEF